MGVDELDNLFDAFGSGGGFEVEKVWPGDGDVGDGAVDFEELEAVGGELLAQDGGDLEWEAALLLPSDAQGALQARAAELAGGGAGEGVGLDRLDEVGEVDFAEVACQLFAAGELAGFGDVEAVVFGLEAVVFDPFFDDGLVLDDFDAGLEGFEGHAGEAFGVEFAQLILVIVVVGGAEDGAAEAALGDESIGAAGRVGGGAFGLVQGVEVAGEDVSDGLVLGEPEGVIEGAEEEGLEGLALSILLDFEADLLAFGFLQNQEGDVKERIGAAGDANLAGEGFDALVVGQENDGDVGRRRERIAPGALAGRGGAFGAASAQVWAIGERAFGPGAAGAVAARGAAAFAFIEGAFAAVVAGEVGIAVDLGRVLRPGGQKKLFEIQFGF